jgi:fumarate reductase iron-sulfur subunit
VLRVFRWAPGGPERWQEYEVAAGPDTTVLDALVEIQRGLDPTLAFRYACRVGMCGSCGMVVGGRERWACRTRLATLPPGPVTVRPLYHFPLLRDLVVDMTPFVRRMHAAGAAFVPSPDTRGASAPGVAGGAGGMPTRAGMARRTRPSGLQTEMVPAAGVVQVLIPAGRPDRREMDEAIECIGCGLCLSACTMVGHDDAFPGPAALNRAFTLQRDPRDGARDDRWTALLSSDALSRCHGQAGCTDVCPMGLAPTRSIIRLRQLASRLLLGV